MPVNKLELIFFDLVGTTVKDTDNGDSLILNCFGKAFLLNGLFIKKEEINRQRGKIKREAIKNILLSNNLPLQAEEKIYDDFTDLLKKSISSFTEMSGASGIFRLLKQKQIKIAVGSGLPIDTIHEICRQISWHPSDFDYLGSSEELGRGRPDPAMILDAMGKLNVLDKTRVLKIGDTMADIEEGKNAGVRTAGVLTGTHRRDELEKLKPDYIFNNINELSAVL